MVVNKTIQVCQESSTEEYGALILGYDLQPLTPMRLSKDSRIGPITVRKGAH